MAAIITRTSMAGDLVTGEGEGVARVVGGGVQAVRMGKPHPEQKEGAEKGGGDRRPKGFRIESAKGLRL